MPIYRYKCEKCESVVELVQGLTGVTPLCCGRAMVKQLTAPAIITIKDKGGTRTYSKGYKEGYSQEYLKSIGKS